jgi:flagellar protein FliO/FliZ
MTESPLWSSLLGTAGALALVLLLAWLVLRAMRGRLVRGSGSDPAPTLRVLRQWPLGPREKLVLIELRGEQCLLGVTAGGMQMLSRWPLTGASPGQVPAGAPGTADNPSWGPS